MSVSNDMSKVLAEAEAVISQGEPRAILFYKAQGTRDALKPFVDRVFALEYRIEKLQDDNYWREKHSGSGRGDSMG